jgi:hypothetical protein
MPAFRFVVSVLLRALGDFSLHPQGRPCGRPPAAAVLGRQHLAGSGPDFPPQPNHRHFNREVRSSKSQLKNIRPRKYSGLANICKPHMPLIKVPNKQITTPLPPQLRGLPTI